MDEATLASAFNEWMRRYVEDPDGYENEWATVRQFLSDEADGEEPSYGTKCAAYIHKIAAEPCRPDHSAG